MERPPSILFHGGTVFTGSGVHEALLTEEGRILAVGDAARLSGMSGAGTERFDLEGRLLLPGLTDHHLHVAESIRSRAGIDLRGATEWTEIERRSIAWSGRHPKGLVWGGGWDEERLREGESPDRARLDRWFGDRPAILDRVCLHVATVNSAALERIGLDRTTPDPPGGRIGRAPDGEPDGRLYDAALEYLRPLRDEIWSTSATEARGVLSEWSRLGLSRIHAMSADPAEVRGLLAMAHASPLPVDVDLYLRWRDWRPGIERTLGLPAAGVALRGVKAHLDGSLGARTAWLAEPYSDRPSDRGTPLSSRASLGEPLEAVAIAGGEIALHAIGDAALGEALSILEALPPGGRHRIEHASVASPALRRRLHRSRASVAIQPAFRESDRWIEARLGPVRIDWAYPFRAFRDEGIPLLGSSDSPVEPADPWHGIRSAVHTPIPSLRRGSLSPREALALYLGGAGGEERPPPLAPGRPANLVRVRAPAIEDLVRSHTSPVLEVWRHGALVRGSSPAPKRL